MLPNNQRILFEILKDCYELKPVYSGEQALSPEGLVPSPDLIILDITMPGMDGFQVGRALKADPHTRDIPVILSRKCDILSALAACSHQCATGLCP